MVHEEIDDILTDAKTHASLAVRQPDAKIAIRHASIAQAAAMLAIAMMIRSMIADAGIETVRPALRTLEYHAEQ